MDSNEYFFLPNVILKYKLKGELNEETVNKFIEIEKICHLQIIKLKIRMPTLIKINGLEKNSPVIQKKQKKKLMDI